MSDEKKFSKLSKKDVIIRGTIIAVIVSIPSLIAFVIIWISFNDIVFGAILGGLVHFIALIFSWKISKKWLTKD